MENPPIPQMNTLVDCMNTMTTKGYTENFKVVDDRLVALSDEKPYDPDDISIVNFYRFESQSDPGDNSILYVIETSDGKKGTVVNGFGASSDGELNEFIDKVNVIGKKKTSEL